MTSRHRNEAVDSRINALGEEFGVLFHDVENDLYSLRLHWRVYVALFATNSERVDLLNSISGTTALLIEKALFEAAMMSVCRLTDPPQSLRGAQKNITVKRFQALVEERFSNANVENLAKLVSTAVEASEFARSWRNKRLAHSDEAVRRGKQAILTASIEKMDRAIDAVASIIRWVGVELMDTHIVTHPISSFKSDEIVFLKALFLGIQEKDRRVKRAQEAIAERRYSDAESTLSDFPQWLIHRELDRFD